VAWNKAKSVRFVALAGQNQANGIFRTEAKSAHFCPIFCFQFANNSPIQRIWRGGIGDRKKRGKSK